MKETLTANQNPQTLTSLSI